jgi:hypothetical protein
VDGTARSEDDYSAAGGTLSIPAGDTEAEFLVEFVDDSIVEADETVQLILSNPVGIDLGEPSSAILTILDNDDVPVISFSSATYLALETEDEVELAVMLNQPSRTPVEVEVSTEDGTAVSGSDFTGVVETVEIPAGQTAAVLVDQ